MNHVYILGAGFSVPLGGPLFNDLLSGRVRYRFACLSLDNSVRNAIVALHEGNRDSLESTLGYNKSDQRLNAEQLIEMLDWVQHHETSMQADCFYGAFGHPTAPKKEFFANVVVALKQVIACECDLFLDELDSSSERWQPYIRWFEHLNQHDTIITYNYDTAVERIAIRSEKQLKRGALHEPFAPDRPVLLKLHGSVDWVADGDTVRYEERAYQKNYKLAMGMPGREKALLQTSSHFFHLRECAKRAIESADCISIIGYSMPETDNDARMMIIDSIIKAVDERAKDNRDRLRINMVLGPDSGSVRAKRMQSMLEPLGVRVTNQTMFAQDYLPYFEKYFDFPPGPRRPEVPWK